jgi:hypothetical protein
MTTSLFKLLKAGNSILSNIHFAHLKSRVTRESYIDERKGAWNRIQAVICVPLGLPICVD